MRCPQTSSPSRSMTLLINILLETVSRQTAWPIKREIISPDIPWLYTCSKEAFMCEVPFRHILHEYFMVGSIEQFIALQLVSFTFMIKVYSSFAKGNFNGTSFYGFLRLWCEVYKSRRITLLVSKRALDHRGTLRLCHR